MTTRERTETREEWEARYQRLADDAEAGCFDHEVAAAISEMLSHMPAGYAFDMGQWVRFDESLPDHVTVPKLDNGRVVGGSVVPAPYRPDWR